MDDPKLLFNKEKFLKAYKKNTDEYKFLQKLVSSESLFNTLIKDYCGGPDNEMEIFKTRILEISKNKVNIRDPISHLTERMRDPKDSLVFYDLIKR